MKNPPEEEAQGDGLSDTLAPSSPPGLIPRSEEQTETEDPFIGQVLDDRYEVMAKIGVGGMGSVYRARQVTVGRDVAVKVLSHDSSANENVVRRFQREAQIICDLRHPCTLKLIDFGTANDGRLYIVTEFVVGHPLEAVLADGPLDSLRSTQFLRQVCESLVEAHERGVIHRDLKPGNIMVEKVGDQEVVKVLDFGIAKLAESSTTTTAGTIFGTPAYMSPEQARGDKIDARTDIYSLGCIGYECLSGVRPFRSETAAGMLMKHITVPPKPLVEHPGGNLAPHELCTLVMSMLEKSPDDRPPSAIAVRDALSKMERRLATTDLPMLANVPRAAVKVDDIGLEPSTAPANLQPAQPNRSRGRYKLALTLTLLVAAVALGVSMLLRPAPVETTSIAPPKAEPPTNQAPPTPTKVMAAPTKTSPTPPKPKVEPEKVTRKSTDRAKPTRKKRRAKKAKPREELPAGFVDVPLE